MPSLLYGASIVGYTDTEIKKLQVIENAVYRTLLGAARYAQVCTLRCMESRIRGSQIKYIHYSLENKNQELLKKILEERRESLNNYYWLKSSKEFIKKINTTFEQLNRMKKAELSTKIKT